MTRVGGTAARGSSTVFWKSSRKLTHRLLSKLNVRKGRLWLSVGGGLSVAFLVAYGVWIQAYRVPYGAYLADVTLGALRWNEAEAKIVEYAKRQETRVITWSIDDKSCVASLTTLGGAIEPHATLRRLVDKSAKRGFWSRLFGKKSPLLPEVTFDETALATWVESCEASAIPDRPVLGRLVLKANAKDGFASVEAGKPGRKIAVERLRRTLPAVLTRFDDSSVVMPVETVAAYPTEAALERAKNEASALLAKPVVLSVDGSEKKITLLRSELVKLLSWQPISAEALKFELSSSKFDEWLATRRHRVEQPARNATYEVDAHNRFTLVPEVAGNKIAVRVLYERLRAALEAKEHIVSIPFEPTELPKLRSADIEGLNIHELMGSFTTKHACCQSRVKNIHRIADLIDGVIVLPGATFSINEYVGPRTFENGFVAAKSIQDGDMMDTIGGGICQFATTFYNAALRSGVEILERQAHSYWFERYPMGHEAALSYPKPDVVIRNDTKSGLLIRTAYDDRSITVKFYGDREGRNVSFGVSSRFDIVAPQTEYLPNLELDPDEEKIKEGGCIGWSVTTTRTVILKDGTRNEDKRKVTYKPRIRRVEVHPCKIPAGEPGATGEKCPKPKAEDDAH
jgi:vancomycin resistance protein YoaR